MLPVSAITEFQQLWKEFYNEEISFEEAQKQSNRVFFAIKATYRPVKREWLKKMRGGEKE